MDPKPMFDAGGKLLLAGIAVVFMIGVACGVLAVILNGTFG